jgi:hypothetical protein
MRPIRPCAIAAATLSLLAVNALPAQAACKRFGFLVNDYGKVGPANDAKALLDKHIKKWTDAQGIADYQIGNKQVKCELFLDVGLFDEYTCTAKASVCWGNEQANAVADDNDEESATPPAPIRKARAGQEKIDPVVASKDVLAQGDAAKSAEQAAEEAEAAAKAAIAEAETAAKQAASASKSTPPETKKAAASASGDETAGEPTPTPTLATETAEANPAVPSTSNVETGALPTNASAAAAEVARTSPDMKEAVPADNETTTSNAYKRAAAAEAAAAAAERAAKAAEQAAAAAKVAAEAAIAASEASRGGPVVPALQ